MALAKSSDRSFHFILGFAAMLIIIESVNQAQSALVSLLVAVFFAMLGTPPVVWLERKGLPNFVAVFLVVLGMFAILLIAGVFVGAAINSFVEEMPEYQTRLQGQVVLFQSWLATKGIRGVDKVLLEVVKPGALMSMTASLLARVGSALSDVLLILFTVSLILLEASSFPGKLRSVLGDPQQMFPQFTRFVGEMERYVMIHTIFSLATGLLIGIWLAILDVDFPVIWGFLAFLLNYVPNVGSMIAPVPAVFMALVKFGPGTAVAAALGCIVINVILGNILEIKVMGQKLGLSTLVVFLSLYFWGSLLGPVGMVLCIPLTMTMKFACENNSGTQWIADLLGPEKTVAEVPEDAELPVDIA